MSKETHTHNGIDLDLSNSNRGVLLVKVPKYVADRWEKAPSDMEIGKLWMPKTEQKPAPLSLTLSTAILNQGEETIPKDYHLDVSTVTQQESIGVFSHVDPEKTDTVVPETEKLFMEGKIVHKLECIPYADNDCYMKMKLESIKKASLPTRKVQQSGRVENSFKPVSDHKNNIEYRKKKKAEGKKVRDDKESVLEMLFAAYEKHQYYSITDLVMITKQPVTYLKEILNEYCNYNLKAHYRNTWELKPEYRHYKQLKPAPKKKSDNSDDD